MAASSINETSKIILIILIQQTKQKQKHFFPKYEHLIKIILLINISLVNKQPFADVSSK